MSHFFSEKYKELVPYTPGEQPKNREYIKLNTNESPFPPSKKAQKALREEGKRLQLYSDPECQDLVKEAAKYYGVSPEEIIFTNGSDEVLNFAMMAYCDKKSPVVFPDITYGFYTVFARLNDIAYREIPLKEDFRIDLDDYIGCDQTIFLANPNAPTGLALSLKQIEKIVKSNRKSIVVIDEAYVDFGGESAVKLIHKYPNLLVTQTFSKSRSMAGARLGVGIACKEIIQDLNTIKYSTNPYNVNRMTMAAGVGSLKDDFYFKRNCKKIIKNREWLTKELEQLGFTVLDSKANFVFAKHKELPGATLYQSLKEKGILVRYFDKERLRDYNRITIGNKKEMEILVQTISNILKEKI